MSESEAGGLEAVEHAHVLVVEVDVDVAVELALGREQLLLGAGMRLDQRAQGLADGGAVDRDLGLAAGLGAQHRWDLDRRHRRET